MEALADLEGRRIVDNSVQLVSDTEDLGKELGVLQGKRVL